MEAAPLVVSPRPKGKGKKRADKSNLAGRYVQKALQNVISTRVLGSILEDENRSKLKGRQDRGYAQFHGLDGHVNQIRECLAGEGPYSRLWTAIDGKLFLHSSLSGGLMLQSGVAFTEWSLGLKTAKGAFEC